MMTRLWDSREAYPECEDELARWWARTDIILSGREVGNVRASGRKLYYADTIIAQRYWIMENLVLLNATRYPYYGCDEVQKAVYRAFPPDRVKVFLNVEPGSQSFTLVPQTYVMPEPESYLIKIEHPEHGVGYITGFSLRDTECVFGNVLVGSLPNGCLHDGTVTVLEDRRFRM